MKSDFFFEKKKKTQTHRRHPRLVSAVSHTLMDKCEAERNPITLPALKALGEAHLKYCILMCYSLGLITQGSVRTLVRSVVESNGSEASV